MVGISTVPDPRGGMSIPKVVEIFETGRQAVSCEHVSAYYKSTIGVEMCSLIVEECFVLSIVLGLLGVLLAASISMSSVKHIKKKRVYKKIYLQSIPSSALPSPMVDRPFVSAV